MSVPARPAPALSPPVMAGPVPATAREPGVWDLAPEVAAGASGDGGRFGGDGGEEPGVCRDHPTRYPKRRSTSATSCSSPISRHAALAAATWAARSAPVDTAARSSCAMAMLCVAWIR